MQDENAFVTLTYDNNHLPENYSVSIREIQLFIKRLRKSLNPQTKNTKHKNYKKIRYFAVGEYGSKTLRPHYHLIIFGFDFSDDRTLYRWTERNDRVYVSQRLAQCWPYGDHEIGSVTKASAGYVARYSLKKVGGPAAGGHYTRVHPFTGEVVEVEPEFATMSMKPGIGSTWFDKYEGDVFPHDFVVIDGKKTVVPHYYKKKLKAREQGDPEALIPRDAFYEIGQRRRAIARSRRADLTPERLAVKEECLVLKTDRLKREVE